MNEYDDAWFLLTGNQGNKTNASTGAVQLTDDTGANVLADDTNTDVLTE